MTGYRSREPRLPDQLRHRRVLSRRYGVERTLGRGGMATVYLAHDRELERPVALKVLSEPLAAAPAFRARFLREARLTAKLVHPNVVQVYDVGEGERGPARAPAPGRDGGDRDLDFAPRCRLPTLSGSCTATSSRRTSFGVQTAS